MFCMPLEWDAYPINEQKQLCQYDDVIGQCDCKTATLCCMPLERDAYPFNEQLWHTAVPI